ncbi:hypothetical protein BDZ88DRAFT_83549 [Geranomyces variabilis]|nr:hypothetical protein BDZ88DRAFT_83549 [Geranomyces variabilis]
MPPALTFQAFLLTFSGDPYQGEPYDFTLEVMSGTGASATSTATLYLDNTPPVAGYARFSELVVNEAAQTAKVVVTGYQDPESGIKELWTRVGGDSSVCAPDFGSSASWVNFTNLTMSTIVNSPLADQTIAVDLSQALQNNWTEVHFAVAVINHAWTNPGDNGVTYACPNTLLVDRTRAKLDITRISAVGDTATAGWSNESSVEVHWLASNVVAGIAFVTANLSVPGLPVATAGPFYDKSASLDIAAGGSIPANTSFTVCMNATSNSMPPIIVSTCKSTILPLARAFDQSCVQTGVTYHPLADGNSNAQGSIWANWTSCTISDNASIGYWLISSTDFRLADHGFASVNDGGVVIAFGPLWPSSSYKFCFTSVATTDFVGQNFCTSSILVDPIPPRPVGGIIDAYAGRGVDVNALAIVSSSNTAEYLVRWDAWSEPPSGIQEFHVNLVGSSQVVANASISDNNGATYAYLFQNLSLEVGQSYYASLSAINHARLESTAIRSRGISITTQNTGSPQVQVTGGTRVQQNGQSLLLFRARNETSITVEWSGFVGMSAQKPTYLVQLAPASPSTTIMPYTITTAQQDLVMAVPGLSGFYTLSVTATAPDGTSRSVAYKYKLWISGVGPSPPSTLYCDVDFSKLDPVKRTVPFSASWSPGPDPGQLLVSQTLAFRRAGSNTSTSSATSLDLLATATSTSVSYLYGAPTLLDQYSIECVYEARDLSGSVTRAIYNGTTHDSLSAFNPTVLALSSAAQVSQPSSTTDFEYFEDVSVTSNGIFSVGLQAFPDIFRNGVQVASLSYSVHWLPENDSSITPGAIGTVDVSPTAEGVEFIVPPTAVDVRSKGFAQYKVLLGSALLPINVFFPSQFLANGGFPSDLSTLFICATVTTWSTNGTVSACNNGIMRDSLPPVAGIVSINATAAGGTLYLIDASSVAVSWAGFSKTNWPYLGETGISQFKWGIGSKAGVDDYVSFATVPGSETSVTADISVENGATLYATVVGYDYVGRAVSAISPLAVVDNTPPVSANSSCQVLSKVNANGSTFVRVSFPPWRDDESGVTSIVWIVETAYGTEDILPRQTATFSTVVFANLPLQPGVAYLARVIATNGAGLSAEIVESFTTASPVKLLYLVDGPDPSQNKLFDNQPSKYTVSWSFAGTVVDFVLGIGTTPRQDDIASFKRTNSSLQTLTVPLHINDGARVFATIFIQDSGGHFQSFVSPGMIVDSSPPIRGWVTVGGLQVHRMTLPRQSVISASWIGFSDPESDINQYEYCLDLNDDIKNPPCAIAGWVNTHTNLQVVDAPIAGAMLPVGRRCFVKVRATNNAGLAIIATSPPFNVDPAIPQGGRASISFPGEDGGNDISPLARDSSQLYIDSSCVKVSWSSFTGNIEKYRVAVLQAPGTMVVPFVSVGTLTNWTFAGLDLATQGPGSQYLAVVQAWTAAGLYSEITTPFKVVQGLPGAGTVTVVSTFATGVTFYLTGFADLNGLAVQYEISIGKNPYGADGPPKLLPDCGSPPCSYTRDVSFGTAPSGTVFFLTVRAQNEAGLFSPSATVPVTLSMPMAHGVSVQRGIPFLWNLTATSPFLNVYQTNAVLTGTNLTNFMSDPNTAVFLTCNFSNTITKVEVVTTGRLQVIGGDVAHPVITCPAPYNEAVDGGYLSLQVQISNALSNPVVFWRRDIVTDWNSTTPQCGLYFVPSSPFRVTSAVTVITWNTKARANVGFFKIKSGNDMLPQIWPASTRKATVFATTPMTTSPMKFSVCAYFIGTSEANARCVDTSPIRVNVVPPSINPQISSNKLGPLSATVRVTTAPNLLPLGTSQYVGPTPVTVAWDGTFIGDGSKSIIKYYVLLGTAPMTATNGTMLATAATTASLTSNLVAGVPYFATVIAVDEVGLTTIAYSSAVIPEISPPDIGTVHIGKNFLPTDIAWQAGSSSIDFYLKGWTDHISGIYEFACRVCSAGSCGPRMTLGIAVSNSIPVNLTAGVPYWVSVQVRYCANRIKLPTGK